MIKIDEALERATGAAISDAAYRPATMTIPEACNYARLSRSFIYKLFEQQALTRLKAGKRVLIMKEDLDRYLYSIMEEVN